jgi:hypothetical protein
VNGSWGVLAQRQPAISFGNKRKKIQTKRERGTFHSCHASNPTKKSSCQQPNSISFGNIFRTPNKDQQIMKLWSKR